MTDTLLTATSLSRSFGGLVAVNDVSVHVHPGEVVGLIGANGAGKSTLIRLLLGLLRPDSGTVTLLGSEPNRRTRRRIGYVPQGLGLYGDLTVAENAGFSCAAYDASTETLDEPELARERDTLVDDLPGALRKRLAFALALAHQPSLLVLDEPTSGIDPLSRSRVWEHIRSVSDRGAGVLVSTHALDEVERCDRAVVLQAGRVIASATPAMLLEGHRALRLRTPRWADAFRALDQAGLTPVLRGRDLRLADVDATVVARTLQGAGVVAEIDAVPPSMDEAFVGLVRGRTA